MLPDNVLKPNQKPNVNPNKFLKFHLFFPFFLFAMKFMIQQYENIDDVNLVDIQTGESNVKTRSNPMLGFEKQTNCYTNLNV